MLKTDHHLADESARLKSKSLERRLFSYAALPAALVLSGGAANAAFVGPYDVANWTPATNGGDGSVDTSGAPGSITLNGSNSGGGGGSNFFIDFAIAALANGFVTFDWAYSSSDFSSGYDFGSFLFNGTPTTLATVNGTNGSFAVAVTAGDVFGFRVLATDDQFGRGFLTISNFDAPAGPSDVPEPTTLSLLALGAAGLALTRRRKKQS